MSHIAQIWEWLGSLSYVQRNIGILIFIGIMIVAGKLISKYWASPRYARFQQQNIANKNLFRPAELGDEEVVATILRCGANPNERDKDGRTPLHFAMENGELVVSALLLDHGADLFACDNKGETPLDAAACSHREHLLLDEDYLILCQLAEDD